MLQSGVTRRNYFSRLGETTYGTPVALSHYANLQGEMATPKAEFYSDTNECVGYEEETSKTLLAQEFASSITGRASDKITPLLLSMALGGDTQSTPEVSSQQHIIAPAAMTVDLPSFTHEQHSIGATDTTAGSSFKWAGCVVNKFELFGLRKNFVQLSADIVGEGEYDDGTSQTEAGLAGPSVYYLFGDTAAWLSSAIEGSFSVALPTTANARVTDLHATGLLALSPYLREVRYTVNNSSLTDEGYGANATATGSRTSCPRDRRVQTLTFVLDFNTTTAAVQQYFLSNAGTATTRAFEWSCVTGTDLGATYHHGWKLVFPKIQFESVERGGGMGGQTLTCTARVQNDLTNATVLAYWWNGDAVDYGALS